MTDSQFDQYEPAVPIVPSQTAAFISKGYKLGQDDLPAFLMKTGLATTETIKLEISVDNGANFIQAVDENGIIQFAATGRNTIPINIPLLFRLNKSSTSSVAAATLSFGKNV